MRCFMLAPEMAEALRSAAVRRPEISQSAIIRQALREWMEGNKRERKHHTVVVETGPQGARTPTDPYHQRSAYRRVEA